MRNPYIASLPKESDSTYMVKDLYLAAALLSLKFNIIEMNIQYEGKVPHPIGYFTFENSADMVAAVNMYLNREMRVEPIEYFTNVHSLKSQVMTAAKSPLAT